jgi:hypothetical protein
MHTFLFQINFTKARTAKISKALLIDFAPKMMKPTQFRVYFLGNLIASSTG